MTAYGLQILLTLVIWFCLMPALGLQGLYRQGQMQGARSLARIVLTGKVSPASTFVQRKVVLFELSLTVQEEVAGGPSLRTPQECQEVWQYLSPYAESMEGDSKMLSRLQGMCTLFYAVNHVPVCMLYLPKALHLL